MTIKAYIPITEKERESIKALFKSIHFNTIQFTIKPVLVVDYFLKTIEFKEYRELVHLSDVQRMTDKELEALLFADYTGELERDFQFRPF